MSTLVCEIDEMQCSECQKIFKRKGSFEKHKLICGKVSIEPEIKCNYCGETFVSLTKLEQHKKTCNEMTCQFCGKNFVQVTRLLNHMCKKKLRHLEKDDRHVNFGYMSYKHYIKKTSFNLNKREITYEEFSNSNMYDSFVDFGKYLMNINAINPLGFVDFLIKIQAPLRNWTAPNVYEMYIRELNKTETPDAALERNFMLMQQWSMENNEDWKDFFRKISTQKAVLWIRSGRISPWLLFSASSASQMMSRMNEEQLLMIDETIDSKFWELKIQRHADEVKYIHKILNEVGL